MDYLILGFIVGCLCCLCYEAGRKDESKRKHIMERWL